MENESNFKFYQMNKFTLPFLFLFITFTGYSQGKKDLQQQVDSLILQIKKIEDSKKYLESELKNVQLNLTNVSTTMSFVTKSNLDLESQVKNQSIQLQKLMIQNDSLLKVFNVSVGSKFVVSPTNESDSIVFVIQNYYLSKKWQDRLAYVLNPESVKSLMENAYKDQFKSYSFEKNQINVPSSNYALGKTFKVFVNGETVYLKKTKDGFKIDWEATWGYNPISISAFKSEESTTPTVLRLTVKLGDLYYEDYGVNSKNYLSMTSELGYTWMTLSSSSELKKILSDGKEHQIIVEACYKTTNDIKGYGWERKDIFFTKFIKDGWDK
jgi:hypothetical protein